jgi:hypothetical protein
MNRREFVGLGTMVMGALALPNLSWAAPDRAKICHIIRLKFDPGISAEKRAQMVKTIHRFKQIHAPIEMVVGKDLPIIGNDTYDYAQISMFDSQKAFYNYFYDPIHLAADREAVGGGFSAISSFDTVPIKDADTRTELNKIMADRTAKFKANDTRPTSPPVADRPQDQKWNYGTTIFRVARADYSGLNPEQIKERIAAIDRLREIKGVKQLFWGAATNRTPSDRNFTHMVLVSLENEEAYHSFIPDPIHQAERNAGGKLPPEKIDVFDVFDPNDEALAERLKKFHAEAGG